MVTIVKQDPHGKAVLQYEGEIVERSEHKVIIEATWAYPEKDEGYARFEPGDHFVEYYYTDRWFNIFEIDNKDGTRKGWYCNITEPAIIFDQRIEQIDLILDVWIYPDGKYLILDTDEFAAATTLSQEQRSGAEQGLQALLQMLANRTEMFQVLAEKR